MTERDPAKLASTVHEFPQFRIWREITTDREPRFVARRRHPGVSPHTVVTPDLAELRAALATSPGRGPAVGPGAFKPRIPHTVQVRSAWLQSARESPSAALIAWSRTFPAAPEQVREARQFLAGILDGHPAADDAILCLSELVTNATMHSRSREPGGQFRVRAEVRGSHVRVEVGDQGGPWEQTARDDGQHGRGLLVVAHVADDCGRNGDAQTGWMVWFEIEDA